jgi:hypothetical protein
LQLGKLFDDNGGASHALSDVTVPTPVSTDPVAAAAALVESWSDFCGGRAERGILRRGIRAAIKETVCHVTDLGERSAEQAAETTGELLPGRAGVVSEGRSESVAASFAAEFELVTVLVREVGDIVGKGNVIGHLAP